MTSKFDAVFYLSLTLTANLACSLLLYLAGLGDGVAASSAELPLIVIIFMGGLFTGAIYHLGQRLREQKRLWGTIGIALLLNAVASSLMFLLIGASPLFFLAPLSAILLGEFYARFLQEDAAMLAAMTVYVLCTLLANFTFDTFIPLPLFGLLSVGTLFFGITFTQRDRVHRYGRTQVYLMILGAAVTNLLLSFYLGIPLRFLLAGFLAIILAEAADTEVYQRFISRRWLTRVVTSNAVSIPIDSVTFTLIAFAGTLSLAALGEIIFADILAKTVIGVVAAARLLRQERGGDVALRDSLA